jgi:hypothetical protein
LRELTERRPSIYRQTVFARSAFPQDLRDGRTHENCLPAYILDSCPFLVLLHQCLGTRSHYSKRWHKSDNRREPSSLAAHLEGRCFDNHVVPSATLDKCRRKVATGIKTHKIVVNLNSNTDLSSDENRNYFCRLPVYCLAPFFLVWARAVSSSRVARRVFDCFSPPLLSSRFHLEAYVVLASVCTARAYRDLDLRSLAAKTGTNPR